MINNNLIQTNVVITGGTSGLGKALASQYVKSGARVAVIARTLDNLEALKREYPELITIRGDISQAEDIYPMVGEINATLGDVNILINSASYLGHTPLRLFMDTECEDFAKVFETNVLGPFRLIKALIPSMLLTNDGVVLNVSSDAAVCAYPTWGAYSVSKSALDHMTHIFHEELKEQNIKFFCVDPGDMNTPMHFAADPEADTKALRDPVDSAKSIISLIANRKNGGYERLSV